MRYKLFPYFSSNLPVPFSPWKYIASNHRQKSVTDADAQVTCCFLHWLSYVTTWDEHTVSSQSQRKRKNITHLPSDFIGFLIRNILKPFVCFLYICIMQMYAVRTIFCSCLKLKLPMTYMEEQYCSYIIIQVDFSYIFTVSFTKGM